MLIEVVVLTNDQSILSPGASGETRREYSEDVMRGCRATETETCESSRGRLTSQHIKAPELLLV